MSVKAISDEISDLRKEAVTSFEEAACGVLESLASQLAAMQPQQGQAKKGAEDVAGQLKTYEELVADKEYMSTRIRELKAERDAATRRAEQAEARVRELEDERRCTAAAQGMGGSILDVKDAEVKFLEMRVNKHVEERDKALEKLATLTAERDQLRAELAETVGMTDADTPVLRSTPDLPLRWEAKNIQIAGLRNDLAERGREVERLKEQHDRECCKLIAERDAHEEALSDAYALVTGNSPEWSNHFGHKEALEEIDSQVTAVRAERDRLLSEFKSAEANAWEVVRETDAMDVTDTIYTMSGSAARSARSLGAMVISVLADKGAPPLPSPDTAEQAETSVRRDRYRNAPSHIPSVGDNVLFHGDSILPGDDLSPDPESRVVEITEEFGETYLRTEYGRKGYYPCRYDLIEAAPKQQTETPPEPQKPIEPAPLDFSKAEPGSRWLTRNNHIVEFLGYAPEYDLVDKTLPASFSDGYRSRHGSWIYERQTYPQDIIGPAPPPAECSPADQEGTGEGNQA